MLSAVLRDRCPTIVVESLRKFVYRGSLWQEVDEPATLKNTRQVVLHLMENNSAPQIR